MPTNAVSTSVALFALALACIAGLWAPAAQAAAPEPAPIPNRWQFDLRVVDHLRIAVADHPEDGPTPYFFLVYRAANFTNADRLLAPSWDLKTDSGEVLRAGRGVPPEVTAELIGRVGRPLVKDQLSLVGPLKQGAENAEFGIVVWPVTELDIDEVSVFGSGFSGESTTYETTDPETGETVEHVLRKSRMLRYQTPGELGEMGAATFPLAEDRWVMR